MKMYVVQDGSRAPQPRWSIEEARQLVKSNHHGHDLNFEWDRYGEKWIAYDWSAMVDDVAPQVNEAIYEVEVPGEAPARSNVLPDCAAVRMEMRITTRNRVSSFEHMDTSDIWNAVDLGKGYLIQQFAARAGRSLAEHLTEEST
jgi:hypothetical protein